MKVARGWAVMGPPMAMSGTVRSVCGTAIFSRIPAMNDPVNCGGGSGFRVQGSGFRVQGSG